MVNPGNQWMGILYLGVPSFTMSLCYNEDGYGSEGTPAMVILNKEFWNIKMLPLIIIR